MDISQATFLSDQAEQRSQGYWLLSKLFLEVPTTDRLLALQAVLGSLQEKESPLQGAIAELYAATGEALRTPESAAVDYTRQLVTVVKDSGEPLPFEAHARENRLPGDATEAIWRLMAESGYPDAASEAASPDHIGAELRLMALFCHDECQAWKSEDPDSAVASLRHQNVLLNEHLVRWVPGYCQGLSTRSEDAYIQAMAGLTRQAIVADSVVLTEISGQVDTFLADAGE